MCVCTRDCTQGNSATELSLQPFSLFILRHSLAAAGIELEILLPQSFESMVLQAWATVSGKNNIFKR